jgi:hypothetical protein
MTESLERIKTRCEAHGLTTKPISWNPEDPELLGLVLEKTDALRVQMPEEKDFRNIIIPDDENIKQVEDSQFDKFRFIKGFEAVWSSDLSTVECEVQSGELARMPPYALSRIAKLLGEESTSETKESYQLPSPAPEMRVFIGISSLEFSILNSFKRELFFPPGRRLSQRHTLRIEGINLKTHAEALDALQKIGNSILFQIDLAINVPVFMAMDRELLRELRTGRRRMLGKGVRLTEPKFEYDNEPMSLYWYARAAISMPLLQFLAYYQVMEFYFPAYSYSDAQQRLRNLMKDPTFDIDKDSDIAQLLSVVRISARGRAFGDEKSQLRATIQGALDNDGLRKFFEDNQERKDFFDVTKKSKSLAKQKISFSNPEADLRPEVAGRIYELRCRIVHTKDEDDLNMLLPMSPEVRNLKHDLELMEYTARKVLIAASRPLKLGT